MCIRMWGLFKQVPGHFAFAAGRVRIWSCESGFLPPPPPIHDSIRHRGKLFSNYFEKQLRDLTMNCWQCHVRCCRRARRHVGSSPFRDPFAVLLRISPSKLRFPRRSSAATQKCWSCHQQQEHHKTNVSVVRIRILCSPCAFLLPAFRDAGFFSA